MNETNFLDDMSRTMKSLETMFEQTMKSFSAVGDLFKQAATSMARSARSFSDSITKLSQDIGKGSHSPVLASLNRGIRNSVGANVGDPYNLLPGVGGIRHQLAMYNLNRRYNAQTGQNQSLSSFIASNYTPFSWGSGGTNYIRNKYAGMGTGKTWLDYLDSGQMVNPKLTGFGNLRQTISHSGGLGNVLKTMIQGFDLKTLSGIAFGGGADKTLGVRFLALGGVIGKLLPVVAAVAVSFGLMVKAATSWVSMMKDTVTGLASSGGNLRQAGQLHGMAAMFGMTGGQFGARARQFGDMLTQGGIPAGIAAQMGIKPYGGLGGDQNYLNKFITAIKDITSDPNFQRASTKARYLGLEDFMWLRDADQSHKDMVFNAQGSNMKDSDRRAAANAQAEMFKMQKELNDAWLEFGRKVLPIVITGLRWLTKVLVFFVDNMTTVLGALVGATIGFFASGGNPIGAIIGGVAGAGIGVGYKYANQGNSADDIIKENSRAVKDNTDAIRMNTMMQNGQYGFGSVGSGNVVPRGWGMNQINESAAGWSIALGAISL